MIKLKKINNSPSKKIWNKKEKNLVLNKGLPFNLTFNTNSLILNFMQTIKSISFVNQEPLNVITFLKTANI